MYPILLIPTNGLSNLTSQGAIPGPPPPPPRSPPSPYRNYPTPHSVPPPPTERPRPPPPQSTTTPKLERRKGQNFNDVCKLMGYFDHLPFVTVSITQLISAIVCIFYPPP